MVATVARRTLAGLAVVVGAVTLTFFLVRLAPGDPVERLLGPQATAAQLAAQRHADRKSTRLNSSHGYISYAVFCLKKKKKNNTHDVYTKNERQLERILSKEQCH